MGEEDHVFSLCLCDEYAVEGVFVGRGIIGAFDGFEKVGMLRLQAKFFEVCVFTSHN